jgi:sulfofructosephosphate aldolase
MPDEALSPLAALARPSGVFAMLALDQRESLRSMLADARDSDEAVPDAHLSAFKVAAARSLGGAASAVLLDVEFGLEAARAAGALPPETGLIVAADRLVQAPGGPVEDTDVDDAVLADDAIAAIADAYKLLVIWRPDRDEDRRRETVEAFLGGCRSRGKAGIVEGIVRPPPGATPAPQRHVDLVFEAAAELGALGPDVYKAEVPTLGQADDDEIAEAARDITRVLRCPWVVLSNGTAPERFDDAAVAAARGGASGFLAGRAIWRRSLEAADRNAHLREVAAPRLRALAQRIDGIATPWWDAAGGART